MNARLQLGSQMLLALTMSFRDGRIADLQAAVFLANWTFPSLDPFAFRSRCLNGLLLPGIKVPVVMQSQLQTFFTTAYTGLQQQLCCVWEQISSHLQHANRHPLESGCFGIWFAVVCDRSADHHSHMSRCLQRSLCVLEQTSKLRNYIAIIRDTEWSPAWNSDIRPLMFGKWWSSLRFIIGAPTLIERGYKQVRT